jgi:hypothetical protein
MSILSSLDSPLCRAIALLDPCAIFVVAPDGRIRFASPNAGRMFGWDPEELVGAAVTELVPDRRRAAYTPFDPVRISEHYTRAREEGAELFALNRDGSEFPVEIAHDLVESAEGLHLVGVVTDLGPLRAIERSARRLRRAAELGTLAAGIAHDFGNTMLAVSGYTAMARRILGDTPKQDLRRAEAAAARAYELVDRLLGFVRGLKRERRAVDLVAVASEAAQLLRPTLPPAVRLQLALDSVTPSVVADESALLQLVVNLMMNAVQAMPGGGLLHLSVAALSPEPEWLERHAASGDGAFVRLEVSDTGAGMEPDVLRQAFEPGFTTRPDGSGLGLYNVKRLLDDLGGVIEIESARGQGTRITISLPAVPGNPGA